MNESAVVAQRVADRAALVGIAITFVASAALVALDPIQTVARLPIPARPAVVQTTLPPLAAPVGASPLVRLALPDLAFNVVSDGRWAAYVRASGDGATDIVVRGVRAEDRWVAYRSAGGASIADLSLSNGLLAFDEVAVARGAATSRVTVQTIALAGSERTVLDSFVSAPSLATAVVTDGERVAWIRQDRGTSEIRVRALGATQDLATLRVASSLAGLALWRDTLAYTLTPAASLPRAMTLDLATRASRAVPGFAYSAAQAVGPRGLVVVGADTPDATPATWLVAVDGTRTRLGADCFDAVLTERVTALRCGSQIEITDAATGRSLYRIAPDAGTLAVFDDGVLWAEGDALVRYDLPRLPNADDLRPD